MEAEYAAAVRRSNDLRKLAGRMLRMGLFERAAIYAFASCCLQSCDHHVHQELVVKLTGEIDLYDRIWASSGLGCQGELVAELAAGEESIQVYRSTMKGGIGVLLDELSVCFSGRAGTIIGFSSLHEGGIPKIVISCFVESEAVVSCDGGEFFFE